MSKVATRTHVWETVLAGQWRDLGSAVQDPVDAAFLSGADGYRFEARGWKYEVDFERMVQVNLSTKRERTLRRAPLPAAAPVAFAPGAAPAAPPAAAPATAATAPAHAAALVPAKASAVPTSKASPLPAAPLPAAPGRGRGARAGAKALTVGKVKTFFPEKGYGFIALNNGGEVFFHVSALDADSVGRNDTVEVSTSKDRAGRLRASKVSLLKKAPVMRLICRNPTCRSKGDRHFEDRCPRGGFVEDDIRDASSATKSSS